MAGGPRATGDRRRHECPPAIADLDLTGPVESGSDCSARPRLGCNLAGARGMKVERGRIAVGICGKEIEVQTCRRRPGGEDGLDHYADLEHPSDQADEVATPILHRVMR